MNMCRYSKYNIMLLLKIIAFELIPADKRLHMHEK
jgi:hypothetical protein